MPDTSTPAHTEDTRRYWTRRIRDDGTWRTQGGVAVPAPGEDLAALRAGLGRSAGTVPKLWPFYTSETDGRVTPELEAEHAALALYGLHQQGRPSPMHRRRVSPGTALRALRESNRFSEEAVNRRVAATVSSTSVPAFVYRLRGLIAQLRLINQPLDYDELLNNIKDWHHTDARRRVRRDWGLAYYAWAPKPEQESASAAKTS
ncbi:type I-E CRISPR-associated protein Cse2/CasB [Streptomyces sp. AV19]|nr:type I-E CRISPR-associated protein Cse2/CasB [Streptomyces sp. AV19]MDG4534907.1 type I-E CRISPR-associated protein Cse2/CasB [Streptomyces sp. AV19]